MDEERYADHRTQTRGEFGGIGIEITMEDSLVKVVSPIDDTPAAKAGILSGDFIVEINGEAVKGMTLKIALDKMRGDVGTDLAIKVRRGSAEPFDLTLRRAVVKSQSVRHEVDGTVGYIRISGFTKQTQSGLEKALGEIDKALGNRLTGYVLDLRNNPGGLLTQSVSVADTFLDAGDIVATRGRDGSETQIYKATPGDRARGLPIILLINGGSASASEIVAGALQDNHRVVVMGTQSFGKGSVQTIMPLFSTKGAIKITTSRYYTPSGRSIQQYGITPDILVEQAKLEMIDMGKTRKEADLKGALSNDTPVKGGQGATPTPETPKAPDSETSPKATGTPRAADFQRDQAVSLLKGANLLKLSGKPANAAIIPGQSASSPGSISH
jgi:carboxyl-terminal processing protease